MPAGNLETVRQLIHSLEEEQGSDVLNGPALPPPPGVVSNFTHRSNAWAVLQAVDVVCLVLATAALIIRLFAKVRYARKVIAADCSFSLTA